MPTLADPVSQAAPVAARAAGAPSALRSIASPKASPPGPRMPLDVTTPAPTLSAALPLKAALRQRLTVLFACALAVAVAAALGDPAPSIARNPDLAFLMRGISLIKASFAHVALVAVLWRCGQPLRLAHAAGYATGCALMAGAAMSVWQLSSMGFASLAFHTGWIALFVVSWVDGVGPALRQRSVRARGDAG